MLPALNRIVPVLFSLLLLGAGAMMLVSSATPSVAERVKWLSDTVPLTLVEFSHLMASLTGVLLLFMARAVKLRLDAAWYGSILILAVGIGASLFKGWDWREAAVLATMLILLLPTRKYFNRRASLMEINFSPLWIALISLILIGSALLGFYAYRQVPYADDIWLRFAYNADAPRFLRALAITSLLILAYVLYRLLGVAKPADVKPPMEEELQRAIMVANKAHDTAGFLALLGDKSLLWSHNGEAFIMFTVTPRYWIAMGDPVGQKSEFEALSWRLREMADRHGAKAVFYQVSDAHLPLYLDLGLLLLKMGEEARIKLSSFSLAGGARENPRKNRNRLHKLGYSVRVLSPEERAAAMPRLREISDAWLKAKNVKEKGFSLGFFDENYLSRTSVAVVEHEGKILAFANLWQLEGKQEIAIDLMRYMPGDMPNLMEFLLVDRILWAQEQGYEWFSMGMAPLSGLEKHPLAPLWHKIGNVIFEHGEELYNFEGLYAYKSKFDPEWRPRYLALPFGPQIPLVLATIASVIGGGVKGVFRK